LPARRVADAAQVADRSRRAVLGRSPAMNCLQAYLNDQIVKRVLWADKWQ
jgi:hypothetical protein